MNHQQSHLRVLSGMEAGWGLSMELQMSRQDLGQAHSRLYEVDRLVSSSSLELNSHPSSLRSQLSSHAGHDTDQNLL